MTARLRDALRDRGVAVVPDQPLGPWTTLGVGGAAALFVEPKTPEELAAVLAALAEAADVPLLVLGRGSNMLVADTGWPGLALRLGAGFKWQRRSGDVVEAGGGTSMPALAAWLATEGLSGLEFAAGIPATVGGSVRMNAGAHGGQAGDRLLSATVATPSAPAGVEIAATELGLGYRRSALPRDAVVVAARWRLEPADPAAIRAKLDDLRRWRRDTQPLRQRNCGSVFTNPPGDSAGRLIEAAGLKGRAVAGAQVSEKHANFIVVEPGKTTAGDVVTLIREVRSEVAARGGPLLEPEVRLVGFGEGW
ncbi:MAG TPA: UDP-N-acetylmuramate dehydrogenase [Frankiaceae bacterium]|nr:UDP-N-acetylmuramate dehydrogenase [Frankiaceae bacterium]